MTAAGLPGGEGERERGFSLVEVLVVVAVIALIAGLGCGALAARPAQARTTAVRFAQLVRQARALAAVSVNGPTAGSTGATIQVVRDGDAYVATLYAFRPIAGAVAQPVRAARAVPLRGATAIAIVAGTVTLAPPFALFFAASGHAAAAAPFTVGSDEPLAAEPACDPRAGIVLDFNDGVHDQAYALSCEMARLDTDTPLALPAALQ